MGAACVGATFGARGTEFASQVARKKKLLWRLPSLGWRTLLAAGCGSREVVAVRCRFSGGEVWGTSLVGLRSSPADAAADDVLNTSFHSSS